MENKKPLEGMALENYNLIVSYLDVIVLAKPTLDLLKTNADFQTLVSKDITIVRDYEHQYQVETENLTRFANAYQAITGKDFSPVSDINIDQDVEIRDTINYNPIFIKNITHLDFDQIANSLNPQPEKVEAAETTPEQAQAAMAAGAVAGSEAHHESNESYHNYSASAYSRLTNEATEQFIAQSAMAVLNYNVAKGDVYIYRTKPKAIPILKWITMAVYVIFLIASIVGTAFSILANGAIVGQVNANGQIKNITWGNGSSTTMVILELVLICMIVFMNIWTIARSFKNENQRYKYSWGWNLFYVLILLMFGLLGVGLGGIINFAQIKPQLIIWNSTGGVVSQSFNYLQDFMYINYLLYSLLGLIIVLIVIAACLNPQRDGERMQALAQDYANKIRSGEIDPAKFNNNSFFGGLGL